MACARVTPCDEQNRECGPVFTAVTRDISPTGISLIHPRALDAARLRVELLSRCGVVIQLIVEVRHRRPIGVMYETGGEFVSKTCRELLANRAEFLTAIS